MSVKTGVPDHEQCEPIGSLGLVYLPIHGWWIFFYGFHVHAGKYTIVPWMRHGLWLPS